MVNEGEADNSSDGEEDEDGEGAMRIHTYPIRAYYTST